MTNETPDINQLQQAIGVRFNDANLLLQALTHRSYSNEHPDQPVEDYERLEYLGDAFLGWVVADELFRRHPGFTEGDLTRARVALVRGETLAEIARTFNAGAYLIMGVGEEGTGGRVRRQTLAAVCEALIGAVLTDQGDATAREMLLRWLDPYLDAIDPAGAPRDAKSALQEACQRAGFALPIYETIDEQGSSHDKHFVVRVIIDGAERGLGEGGRKVEAEQAAAANALADIALSPDG
jgi:ribonuclease-3